MWGLASTSPAPMNPKFRETYTCVYGPNGPEYSLQVIPFSDGSGSWCSPQWGAPHGSLSGVAVTSSAAAGGPWGGSCSKEEEVTLSPETSICSSACSSDFRVTISSSAEGGGPLGAPPSPGEAGGPRCGVKRRMDGGGAPDMKQQRICGMWHVA